MSLSVPVAPLEHSVTPIFLSGDTMEDTGYLLNPPPAAEARKNLAEKTLSPRTSSKFCACRYLYDNLMGDDFVKGMAMDKMYSQGVLNFEGWVDRNDFRQESLILQVANVKTAQ